jgi:hypothetical protein
VFSAPDEFEHERRSRGRVRFKQEVAGVEHMGFHPGQRLHPRLDFGEFEIDIVPAAQQQRTRLPG